ncbi:Maebl [Loktanella sp. D2R18]|uniref:NYN domain-containing protein n=1 Tax=Rhodobacterales TaxID=204455 RepID=UPI000DE8B420|nr:MULTISPECIES: NYN domain-containing protein [Rhodobacterales]MDO6590835.1 NYN domain-containing protein [Yoonia sp. 1_MG-2023]RBW43381.1 Maebl [Loktanella sp. D2R18]
MSNERKLFAVLIDADNISAKYAEAILREVKAYGEPALRRVYGDWSSPSLSSWKTQVVDLGLVANQETANTKGKNASDIGLVIDAMDILHAGRFDGFVLVSSDSDFTALASRLREDGVEVIGIGENKAPASLRNVCNRFILIENLVDQAMEPDQAGAADGKPKPITQPRKLIELIRAAMRAIEQEDDWYRLGTIGSYIVRANPDFDPRTHGRSKLSELVAMLDPFETRKVDGNHLEIRHL